jgi:hypothetical protein
MDNMKITKTDLALVVRCKCGEAVAATVIYGGISIDEDFTDTIATVYSRGGKAEVVCLSNNNIRLCQCSC